MKWHTFYYMVCALTDGDQENLATKTRRERNIFLDLIVVSEDQSMASREPPIFNTHRQAVSTFSLSQQEVCCVAFPSTNEYY